ncbi:hypothetical protein [Nonomuraea jabiensis]|uniref:Uncharacterized protein n=1 Tax=Nonomuraea jabiensis TaxID=882448 RepID=A0A7W9GDI9_9ACTN|nr:hypothetical protein [Nonomuraea jabiensis]MBB5781792.1 hypothetical protein [Nonomuraea jabiensis]
MPRDAEIVSSDEVHAGPTDGAMGKRTPAQVLREARARDGEIKRGRVLRTLDEMAAEAGAAASAASLAADLELAKAELRTLRAERDRLKASNARLREALKESEDDRAHFQRRPTPARSAVIGRANSDS